MIWCYCCSWSSKFAFLFIPTRLAPGVLLCKNQFLFSKRLACFLPSTKKNLWKCKTVLKARWKTNRVSSVVLKIWFFFFILDIIFQEGKRLITYQKLRLLILSSPMLKEKPTGCSYIEYQGDQHYCVNKEYRVNQTECLHAINTLKSAEMSFQKRETQFCRSEINNFAWIAQRGLWVTKPSFSAAFSWLFSWLVFSLSFSLPALTQSGNSLIK